MSLCITKRKDGRFMGRFAVGRSADGKASYHYVYGKTYDEALKKVQIGQEVESRYLSNNNISVSQAYQEWLSAIGNRVKESTCANYRTKFEKHILPEFGETLCCDLTAGKINTFINKKLADGLSAGYVRDIFTVLRSMLRYAQEEYGFHISLRNVALPKIVKRKAEKISGGEQKKLTAYLKDNMDHTAIGILLSLYMGLRIGELCGLRWADIDLENKVIYVRRTIQRISVCGEKRKTKVIISSPKSDSSFRAIAIPDFIMPYLEDMRSGAECYLLSGSENCVEPRAFQYRYKKILAKCRVKDHNFHQLRHTFATNCMQQGFDAKTLSIILGHKNVNITLNRYIHPDRVHERRLMNSISALF